MLTKSYWIEGLCQIPIYKDLRGTNTNIIPDPPGILKIDVHPNIEKNDTQQSEKSLWKQATFFKIIKYNEKVDID